MNPTVTSTKQNSDGTWENVLSTGTTIRSANPQSIYAIPPTTPAPVPTSAPKVQTPVVSGTSAANFVSDTIVPTMNDAKQSVLQAQLARQQQATIGGVDQFGNVISKPYAGSTQEAQNTGKPAPTPEELIADTPDAGYKWAYGADGARTQIPLTTSATQYGMFDSNPTVAPVKPVVGEAQLASGTTVKQFNDNTYGLFDVQGKYLGNATETQFRNARNTQDTLDKLNQAVNGAYPLKPEQQAQIDGVRRIYENLVKKQELANAQLTGGMTVAQNLYGMGNTTIALGAIKQTIDDGISKIGDIQSKMVSDISKMESAFKSDNLQELKSAYESFSLNQKALQDNLDTIQSTTTQIERDQKQQEATALLAIDNDIRGLSDMLNKSPGATAEQKQAMAKALLDHDYNAAMKAVGNSLETAPGWMGDYMAYAKVEQSKGRTPKTPVEFKNWDDNNKAIIAKAGATITGIAPGSEVPFQATIDSAINSAPQSSRNALKSELYSLAQRGDYVSLLNRVEQNTKTQLTAENRTKLENAQIALPYLTELNQKLKQYEKMGGDMGFIKGTEGNIANKFGQYASDPTKDKDFQVIAAQLQRLFQEYRLEMTGAAFSDAESREYAALMPTSNKNLNLNFALLTALKNSKEARADASFSTLLPSGSYLNLKSKADEQLYGTMGDVQHPLNKQADDVDSTIIEFGKTHPEHQKTILQMEADGATPDDIMRWVNQQE